MTERGESKGVRMPVVIEDTIGNLEAGIPTDVLAGLGGRAVEGFTPYTKEQIKNFALPGEIVRLHTERESKTQEANDAA